MYLTSTGTQQSSGWTPKREEFSPVGVQQPSQGCMSIGEHWLWCGQKVDHKSGPSGAGHAAGGTPGEDAKILCKCSHSSNQPRLNGDTKRV